MDVTRLREDFERLTPEDQMELMASVGPTFCRRMMSDPARRRQMMARCLREGCRPVAAVLGRLRAARAMARALVVGFRAGVERLRQSPTHEATTGTPCEPDGKARFRPRPRRAGARGLSSIYCAV